MPSGACEPDADATPVFVEPGAVDAATWVASLESDGVDPDGVVVVPPVLCVAVPLPPRPPERSVAEVVVADCTVDPHAVARAAASATPAKPRCLATHCLLHHSLRPQVTT